MAISGLLLCFMWGVSMATGATHLLVEAKLGRPIQGWFIAIVLMGCVVGIGLVFSCRCLLADYLDARNAEPTDHRRQRTLAWW